MFTNSIRWRLLAWLGFLLACILVGFGVTAWQLNRVNDLRQIDEGLERRVTLLTSDVRGPKPPSLGEPPSHGGGPRDLERRTPPSLSSRLSRSDGGPGGPSGPPPEPPDFRDGPTRSLQLSAATASLFEENDPNGPYYWVWFRNGAALQSSADAPGDIALPAQTNNDTGTHTRTREIFRETWRFTERGDGLLAGVPITAHQAATRRFAWWLVAAGSTVLTLGLGGGLFLVGRALRPVEAIGATAARISAGNLAERIDVSDTASELGQLAQTLNSTFARLDAAFAEQRRFSADASHELRTPLAVLIAEAQTTLARERSAADYRATVEGCLETAQQMRRLTESLLEFARFDAGQEALEHAPLDLADPARACIALIRPLALAREITVYAELAPAPLTGDADRLSRVITNLLNNAIHYNVAHGEIRIATRAEKNAVVLTVANTGPGIAPEDVTRIFERFYRADKSRSRADGRSGLGLAICQAIVQAHRGESPVESRLGAGATFAVRLPTE